MILKAWSGLVNFPGLVLYWGAVLFLVQMQTGDSVLPGLHWADGIAPLAFGRWLLLVTAPLIINGWILEKLETVSCFVRLRLRFSFCLFQTGICLVTVGLWSLLTAGLAILTIEAPFLPFLILVGTQGGMWMVWQVFLFNEGKGSAATGAGLIVLIGMCAAAALYMPQAAPFLPTSWGMLRYSTLMEHGGINWGWMAVGNTATAGLGLGCLIKNGERK